MEIPFPGGEHSRCHMDDGSARTHGVHQPERDGRLRLFRRGDLRGDRDLAGQRSSRRPAADRKAFGELFTGEARYDVEYRIRCKDGLELLHDRSVSTYEKDGQWYADGLFSDITERKRLEEELRRHTEHLEELVAARAGELAGK